MQERTDLYQQRLKKFIEEVTLYPVSCERLARGRDDLAWLDAVLAGGAKIVQLRDKESDGLRLCEKAKIFRQKTLEAGALFIVNDRVDIALISGADGVHLGNSDIPAAGGPRPGPGPHHRRVLQHAKNRPPPPRSAGPPTSTSAHFTPPKPRTDSPPSSGLRPYRDSAPDAPCPSRSWAASKKNISRS